MTSFKRRPLRPHHYGAAWKVAYADFTTAMMALFVVLWLLTQADVRLRQQIAQYFRQPGVLPGGAVISPYANELYSRTPKVVTRELLVAQGQGEQELLENEKKAIDQALMRRPELAPAESRSRGASDGWLIVTDTPVWAAAPGQAAVFYDGERCLGGGRIAPGQHIVYPPNSPLSNLYVAMLDAFGAPVERFADSTGPARGVLAAS